MVSFCWGNSFQKKQIMFALTEIKGVGRRYANVVCKKADVDLNKRLVSFSFCIVEEDWGQTGTEGKVGWEEWEVKEGPAKKFDIPRSGGTAMSEMSGTSISRQGVVVHHEVVIVGTVEGGSIHGIDNQDDGSLISFLLPSSAGELNPDELERIVTIIQNPTQFKIPNWFLNRQKVCGDLFLLTIAGTYHPNTRPTGLDRRKVRTTSFQPA